MHEIWMNECGPGTAPAIDDPSSVQNRRIEDECVSVRKRLRTFAISGVSRSLYRFVHLTITRETKVLKTWIIKYLKSFNLYLNIRIPRRGVRKKFDGAAELLYRSQSKPKLKYEHLRHRERCRAWCQNVAAIGNQARQPYHRAFEGEKAS